MKRRKHRRFVPRRVAIGLAAGVTLAAGAALAGGLAQGPFSTMSYKLEKGPLIFDVDVLRANVRVGEPTRDQLAKLAKGHRLDARREARIARVIMNAEDVLIQLTFLRKVSLDRFIGAVLDDLGKARKAGLIGDSEYQLVKRGLPRWFAVIAKRGFRAGDRLSYRVERSSLRTVLVTEEGQTLIDQTDAGAGPRKSLLAGYFAPGTTFRHGLIESLF